MKLLLDTHSVLWFWSNIEKVSKTALDAILEPQNVKYISIVTAWELAVKISIGKLKYEGGITAFFAASEDNGFEILPLKKEHIKLLETLPFLAEQPRFQVKISSKKLQDELQLLYQNMKPSCNSPPSPTGFSE